MLIEPIGAKKKRDHDDRVHSFSEYTENEYKQSYTEYVIADLAAGLLHTFAGQQANRCVQRGYVLAIHTAAYPIENAHVLAVAGPQELVAALTEPVHVEDLRHLRTERLLSE